MPFWSRKKPPEEKPAEETAPPAEVGPPIELTKGHVLIVEDSDVESRFLEVLLQKNGYRTTRVVEAADAMKECSKNRPDLILLDINLPAGDPFSEEWDGTKFMRWLRQSSKDNPPVIVVTGDSTIKEAELKKIGVALLYHKPAPPSELLEGIEQLLRSSSSAPPPA